VSLPTTQSAPDRVSRKVIVPNGRTHVVGEFQRGRILAATAQVLCEDGFASATVGRIVSRAGISRRTFYQLFADLESCVLECFDDALVRLRGDVTAAWSPEQAWVDRTRAALCAILSFFDDEPQLARLLVVETLAAGPEALSRRRELLDLLAAEVQDGGGAQPRDRPTSLVAEALVGGIVAMIHTRLLDPAAEPLLALSNQLMSMIALPYLGQERARRELERRPPPGQTPRRRPPQPPRPVPGGVVNMRLTYRTVRTLGAIRDVPGSSNAHVGAAAGIADPGQISKLLARLARLGLLSNERALKSPGHPNAWRLTDDGLRLLERVAQESWGRGVI
jgi:AcrR family transcriptional regulator